jgi:SAM-dependent methyltransferase
MNGMDKRMIYLTAVFTLLFIFGVKAQDLDVPYVSTPHDVVKKMLDVADVGAGDYVIDLGCGDGRIVISAALRGAAGHGVDLDPERIRDARENARKAGVSDRVMFVKEDIFKTDFSRANVVTMYLLTTVNADLRPRLLDILEPGTRVVSHDFGMGTWEPDKYIKMGSSADDSETWKSGQLLDSDIHEIYYWVVPANVEGRWNWQIGKRNFVMEVEQSFQEINPQITEDGNKLNIKRQVLKGDRISITAVNPGNGIHYVFNGRINEDEITGKAQVRGTSGNLIKNWSAVRK